MYVKMKGTVINMKYTAGFIGVGNMGGALFESVCNCVGGSNVAAFDTDEQKLLNKTRALGAAYADIDDVASNSKFVFLGVKPNIITAVAERIKNSISDNTVLVSMAAGVSTADVVAATGTEKVIRIMPNTPVTASEGTVLYCTASGVTQNENDEFCSLMCNAGLLDRIDEKLIDAAAALSGCGPAYVYMFIDALADGAVKCGLPRDKALLYAKQTVLGSAKLAINSDKHPEKLKDEVCSPGGTTIEGVMALEKGAFRHTVSQAVISAYEKTSKLKAK